MYDTLAYTCTISRRMVIVTRHKAERVKKMKEKKTFPNKEPTLHKLT